MTFNIRGHVTGSVTSSGNPLYILVIPAAGIALWSLVIAAEFVLISAASLIGVLFSTAPDSMAPNIFLSGIAGAFAGIATAMVRSLRRKPSSIEKSFISALFSKGLAAPSLDGPFWIKTLLSTFIGFLVGMATGADGFISFPQAFTGTARDVFSVHYPLVDFLGGGLGGSGAGFAGPDGFGFWSALFLMLVIILTALLIGSLSGLFVHLLVKAVAGATKASTKELVIQSLEDPAPGEEKGHPIGQGIIRGALTGVLVGVIEALFTISAVNRFYRPWH